MMSTSDDELVNAMEMYEEDEALLDDNDLLNAAMELHEINAIYENALENQREWQRNFIQQSGGQINPEEPFFFFFHFLLRSYEAQLCYNMILITLITTGSNSCVSCYHI